MSIRSDSNVRIRIYMLMVIQIRIRSSMKTMLTNMRILPQVLNMLKNKEKFYNFYSQQCQFTMIFLSYEWKNSHDCKYFGRHIEIFWKN